MTDNLLELKNIGNTSAHWLKTVGINTPNQLQAIGPISAYKRIQERGIKTSKVLLYALYGALEDVYWSDIPESKKAELNALANQPQEEALVD
ncbi:MAG: TfoX/Sxy family protein [Cellvibrionales bacterium]|nr:TfoX/Sxy family protein [Cellvibrionales bacterium]